MSTLKTFLLFSTLGGLAAPVLALDLSPAPGGSELDDLYLSYKANGDYAPAWLLDKLFPEGVIDDPNAPAGADRQGGNNPTNAVVIASLPYSDTGSTTSASGATNSVAAGLFTTPTICTQVGAWSAGGARDRSYKITLAAATSLNIDLCSSGYDTAVGVFVANGNAVGACVARDDDACGTNYRSKITSCVLPAGTYFIIVDGYGTSSGAYTLSVANAACNDMGCPVGFDAAFEFEGNGMDSNGGCNMTTPAFEPVVDGSILCGTTWADGGVRDTDWFELVLTESSRIHATVAAGCVPMNVVVVDAGCPATLQFASASAAANASATANSGCLPAGTYHVVAVPQGTAGFPATGFFHYGLSVTADPCVLPCAAPTALACGDVINAPAPTENNFVAGSPSCTGYAHNGFDHEYALTIPLECDVAITMDNVGTMDAALLVRTICSDANSCIAGADATTGGNPEVVNVHLLPGTYFVIADFFNASGEAYTLNVECTNIVEVDANDQPLAFNLGQAVPNPFNPSTTIAFSVAETGSASLRVYDLAGHVVATLVNGLVEAGSHSVVFDGSQLASGVYFYTLQAGALVQSQKMVLVK